MKIIEYSLSKLYLISSLTVKIFSIIFVLQRESVKQYGNVAIVKERHERILKGPRFGVMVREQIKESARAGEIRDVAGIYALQYTENMHFLFKETEDLLPPVDYEALAEAERKRLASIKKPLTFEDFKTRYETDMEALAEKKKEEEEKRKKEQELLEEQRLAEEEMRRESQMNISRKSMSKGAKDESIPGASSPENKESEASQAEEGEKTEEKEEAPIEEQKEEEKKEEEPLLVSKPLKISPGKIIAEMDNYALCIKSTRNIVAGELLLLPLDSDKLYTEYASTENRIVPVKAGYKEEEEWKIMDIEDTSIRSYFTDIYAPLKKEDWAVWLSTLTKLSFEANCIGYLKIPPLNSKWKFPLDAGVMHVLPLPNEGISLYSETLPLDSFIQSIANYQEATRAKSDVMATEIFRIVEYDFPHACSLIAPGISPEELADTYSKLVTYIEPDHDKATFGIYLLLTEKWIFVAPLTRSYETYNDEEVFLHPLSFSGVITIPKLPVKWPQTVGMDPREKNPLKILKIISSL